mmetsp:Transcript_41324/g.109455  ORF Transcript_41324/g.109455 Transcript_41324/m.109455 type:complete len:145 (-) Transcript_41324:269-703(-)
MGADASSCRSCNNRGGPRDPLRTMGAEKLEAHEDTTQAIEAHNIPDFEAVPAEEVKTYTVILDKAGGSNLGLDVDHSSDTEVLPIRGITGGLAAAWNAANPSDMMMIGDEILQVNGVGGDVAVLLERCRRDHLLRLLVRRCAED